MTFDNICIVKFRLSHLTVRHRQILAQRSDKAGSICEGMVFRKSKGPVPTSTVQKILRNRIYTGDFDWKGETHHGTYTPLVSMRIPRHSGQ
jgi:hypothetical protein